MDNVIDILRERGFIEQTTHDKELIDALANGGLTCYIGFDPTASSLHVGSLVPIMSLAHMQRCGHRPIALIGGGTGLVGDPSGKTEMRQLLSIEQVNENALGIKAQLSRFIDFANEKALLLNNADWLVDLGYISFLRDIGRYFSVNRMIKAESYKVRLDSEEGLNFIEFNYMLLQAYDFLVLFDQQNCMIQMGGSDQWGNIVAGIDLIRKMRQATTFGITFPLITTSSGQKMGKTAKGAVWLDPNRTSPYEYYQFWVNTDDRDIERFLSLFTFLPVDEIKKVKQLKDAELNCAKMILAYEATKLAHGKDEAVNALKSSLSLFGDKQIPKTLLPSSDILRTDIVDTDEVTPTTCIDVNELETGVPAYKLFQKVGLCNSGGAARRLIDQGGAYINGARVESFDELVTIKQLDNDEMLLRAGKKRYHKLKIG